MYVDYIRGLPVGSRIEVDLAGDDADAGDGVEIWEPEILDFVLYKNGPDNFVGLPFTDERRGSSAAEVVRYMTQVTQDTHINVSHGKDPRVVKKEIADACAPPNIGRAAAARQTCVRACTSRAHPPTQ